ncbi:hypothetical protein SLS62_000052 [Diatrype stigma]|uniref:Uncharacterized protein n=1 Tax=Diatrype stigma TaxID=117547 RepID=A0AAN9V3X1_9PEZI
MHPSCPDIGVVELLEADIRPTFIIALPSQDFTIVYANPALRADKILYETLDGTAQPRDGDFWTWVRGGDAQPRPDRVAPRACATYMNKLWTRSVVRNRWVVVGSNHQFTSEQNEHQPEASTGPWRTVTTEQAATTERSTTTERSAPGPSSTGTTQHWVLEDFTREKGPFVDVIRNFDWASTPLGPMRDWPALLRQSFAQILADPRPVALYWGNDLTTLYNEAFSTKLRSSKHQSMLGRPVEDVWPDTHEELKRTMRESESGQYMKSEHEWCLFLQSADGTLVETYVTWTIVPIPKDRKCFGFIHVAVDATSRRLWERRARMLIELGDMLGTAHDVKSYWAMLLQNLAAVKPSYDVPLAILYSVEDGTNWPGLEMVCRLEGSLDIPDGHPIIPPVVSLDERKAGLSPAFARAIDLRKPILLQTKDGSFPAPLLEGLKWRGFTEPCREAVIFPILPTKDEHVKGLLLLGINPRAPFDNEYRQYISLLSQKLASTLASTVLLEEEARRGRNMAEQAAYDQARLKEKLEFRTKEANETMQKLQAIAEFIPVGMCFADRHGRLTFANDSWYRITGQPKTAPVTSEAFLNCVVEEDRPNVRRAFGELRRNLSSVIEFRVRRSLNGETPLQHPIGSSPSLEKAGLDLDIDSGDERHVLASLKAERAPDGNINQVLACLTDVTLHKKAAEEAMRRAKQAENLKRMAEYATVGLYDMDLEGHLTSANNVFYEFCGIEKVDLAQTTVKPFRDCVDEADIPALQHTLDELIKEQKTCTLEIRLKTTCVATDSAGHVISAPRCVVATFLPVRDSEGALRSFTGCLSDVSLQRWQLERERQRKDEAIESKRQQENFIDITSHEMRNPLGAIVQAADTIIGSLTKAQELAEAHAENLSNALGPDAAKTTGSSFSHAITLLKDAIEGGEIIIACAAHQKRIVDDILTMSKLDSNLLAVTPTTVDPIQVVRQAFKMFEVEARRVDINLSMEVDRSYNDLNIDFLDLDPSRLKQVLINLLTNALKFTKDVTARNVSVEVSASKTRPKEGASSVRYIPPAVIPLDDVPKLPLVPEEDKIYLMFKVTDTGQGMTEEEMSTLFQRFAQANPRTHVLYGGSGLGLFISRQLTEMQNGAIGVASRPGHGSTFAFYIEAHLPSPEALREARAAADAVYMRLSRSSTRLSQSIEESRAFEAETPPVKIHINGILIVEDNLINQQISRRGLLEHGYTVDVANHGLEALDKIQHTTRAGGQIPLDLILMDIEMPIQDGLTCTRNIREMERTGQLQGPRIPIIAVSANARTEQIMEAKAAGCDDMLVKPFRMPDLIEKMTSVMRALKEAQQMDGGEREREHTHSARGSINIAGDSK